MRKTGIYILFFLAVVFLSGCAQKLPAEKLTSVTIAFQEWVGYGPFYLAQENGFMREEGIELIFVDEQLDSARRDAFKQGILDCEAGTIDLLVSKAAQGTPIVAVMEIDQSFGGDAVVAAEHIKTLEDLAGKKVALARDDVGETFISVLFSRAELPFNNMTILSKQPEEVSSSFLSGEADACVTWEPQVSQALRRQGAHILASSKDYPGIIIDTLNVRRDLVEKSPELIKKLVRGWFKALKYYKEDPLEASEIIAKYYKITAQQYRKQIEGLLWDDYETQRSSTESKEWIDAFNAIAEVKFANTRISELPDAVKFLDHTLLESLYEVSP